MRGQTVQPLLGAFWDLVARQHGVISRRQMLALGFSAAQINRRIAAGRLRPVWPGVYAVGRPELSREGRWMAAVLFCGAGAALSHGSAGALLRVEDELPVVIEVSVPATRSPRSRPGLVVHRRAPLGAEDLGELRDIPVTSPARTLLDLATRLSPRRLEAAVNAADKHDLIDPPTLRAYVDERRGQPGVRALRQLLDRHTLVLTDSELERLFLPIAKAAGLPSRTRRKVNGFRVDFYWPDLGLVVETDGLRYHRTPAQQARDRIRDQKHTAAGLIPLRFTHAQVKYEAAYVEATLRRTVQQLATRRP